MSRSHFAIGLNPSNLAYLLSRPLLIAARVPAGEHHS